jgi:hypothetical protein
MNIDSDGCIVLHMQNFWNDLMCILSPTDKMTTFFQLFHLFLTLFSPFSYTFCNLKSIIYMIKILSDLPGIQNNALCAVQKYHYNETVIFDLLLQPQEANSD